ncbi:hypothetical protein CLOM_g9950 [Closterium sp. NIES-68]|nr:hypothetical protein CLOM_g9950 [Closterium sp. NIES-68]GJP68452.1 hypothetical protein CLOP_g25158 [Closterium sp. NIES-67]GJP87069.1 hypothetical protein CLOP_g17040 [Closterium sp. NIES-67]
MASAISPCLLAGRSLVSTHRVRYGTPLSVPRDLRFTEQRRFADFSVHAKKKKVAEAPVVEEVVEEELVEEEIPEEEAEPSWVSERVTDVQQTVQSVMQAVPGPRVGESNMPWLVALPLGYMALTFVLAVYKTVKMRSSPKAKRRRQIGKNAGLNQTIDEFLPDNKAALTSKELKSLEKKFNFSSDEILRKYIRYIINEKPFTPETVSGLIHLRRVSGLDDLEIAEVLNEISRRIVKAKGPVVMDTTGFTEKGVQRKAAVQGIFTKLLYLSELDDFCGPSGREKLEIKSIFGVTDEDAASIRIVSLSSSADLDALDKSLDAGDSSDSEADEP